MLRGGCLGFGIQRGVQSRAPGVLSLNALSLDTSSVAESAAVGAVVGTLQGVTTGSTLTLTDSALGKFALNGSNIEVAAALNYESATSHNITVQESAVGYSNTPRSTVLTITVTNVADAATLVDLALSNNAVPEDSAVGTIVGAVINGATGSTITLTDDAGGKFALNAGNIEVAGALAFANSPYSIELTEALADSPNSPHVTTLSVLATDATPVDLAAITLTKTTAAGVNPMEWDSDFTSYVTWDGVDSGDQHRLVFTLDGVETVEAWQGLDDELLTGGFTWPLWEAAKPFAGGTVITVYEQRRRLVGGVQVAISDPSNILSDTMAAASFAPADLYGVGDVGYAWNTTDLTKVWQNNDGSVAGAFTSVVGRVNDVSGLGNNLNSQNNAGRRPVLQNVGNGMMKFDGADDCMAVTPCLWAGGAGTVIMAVKGPTQDGVFLMGESSSASSQPVWAPGLRSNINQDVLFYHRSDAGGSTAVNKDINVFDDTLKVYAIVDDGAVVTFYVNGVSVGTHNYTSRASLGATTINQAFLGNVLVAGMDYDVSTSAYVGSGIVIDRALAGADLTNAIQWVADLHGVTIP